MKDAENGAKVVETHLERKTYKDLPVYELTCVSSVCEACEEPHIHVAPAEGMMPPPMVGGPRFAPDENDLPIMDAVAVATASEVNARAERAAIRDTEVGAREATLMEALKEATLTEALKEADRIKEEEEENIEEEEEEQDVEEGEEGNVEEEKAETQRAREISAGGPIVLRKVKDAPPPEPGQLPAFRMFIDGKQVDPKKLETTRPGGFPEAPGEHVHYFQVSPDQILAMKTKGASSESEPNVLVKVPKGSLRGSKAAKEAAVKRLEEAAPSMPIGPPTKTSDSVVKLVDAGPAGAAKAGGGAIAGPMGPAPASLKVSAVDKDQQDAAVEDIVAKLGEAVAQEQMQEDAARQAAEDAAAEAAAMVSAGAGKPNRPSSGIPTIDTLAKLFDVGDADSGPKSDSMPVLKVYYKRKPGTTAG
eukprot:GHVU01130253.1.p1 GENE.GHVU01130253.1~~GHVU01130253.1.p1  ORF type:complete len:478 (+),score=95.91 GHVU01130253.1:180-1436(+)